MAHKRYECGCKVSVAASSKCVWFVAVTAMHGIPYDGHTVSETSKQAEPIGSKAEHAFVDMGCRGHDYRGDTKVHVG